MTNTSPAALVVAAGRDVPASFLGMDWLLTINLWVFMAGALICFLIAAEEAVAITLNRKADPVKSPAWVYRVFMCMVSSGVALRLSAAAMTLLAYTSPEVAVSPSGWQIAQRFIDPIASPLVVGGLIIAKFAREAIISQLRKEPYPVERWGTADLRQMYAVIILLCLVAASFGSFFR